MIRRMGTRLFLLFLAVAFALGLGWVFRFQYEAGGSYPQGSSLRADPEGAMILYESLRQQPAIEVLRNFDPPGRFRFESEGSLMILLNVDVSFRRDPDLRDWVEQGGRVVLTPGYPLPTDSEEEAEDSGEDEKEEEVVLATKELLSESESLVASADALAGLEGQWEPAIFEGEDPYAPLSVQWRKGAVLRNLEGEVLYSLPMGPVAIRVKEGKGEWLVLSSPDLFLNLTQYDIRETDFLTWLIGDAERVVFDETHFDIERPRGIMTLLREGGLDVLIWAMVLPLGLALWRGVSPLLPAIPDDQELTGAPLSRLEGYRDLLARHLPAAIILSHAVEEWKRDLPDRAKVRLEDQILEAEAIAKAKLPYKDTRTELGERVKRIMSLFSPRKRAHHE